MIRDMLVVSYRMLMQGRIIYQLISRVISLPISCSTIDTVRTQRILIGLSYSQRHKIFKVLIHMVLALPVVLREKAFLIESLNVIE